MNVVKVTVRCSATFPLECHVGSKLTTPGDHPVAGPRQAAYYLCMALRPSEFFSVPSLQLAGAFTGDRHHLSRPLGARGDIHAKIPGVSVSRQKRGHIVGQPTSFTNLLKETRTHSSAEGGME